MKVIRYLVGAATVAFCEARLLGQSVLISWELNGVTADATPVLSGNPSANVSGGSMTLGSGLTPSSAGGTFGGSGFNQSSFANAISANDYISFSITPVTGYALNITSIDYYAGKSSNTSTSFTAILTSDKTGFSTTNALDTYTFTNGSAPLRSISLTSPALQNVTSTVEFRLYGIPSATTDTFRIRNVTSGSDLAIKGSLTAIPEPSTYAAIVGAASLVGAIWWRRRQSGPPPPSSS